MRFPKQLLSFVASQLLVLSASATERQTYELPVLNFSKGAQGYYVNVSDAAYRSYIGDSFAALNWPAQSGVRGEPDKMAKHPVEHSPVVWGTMPEPQQVFLPSTVWEEYPTWERIPSLPAGLTLAEAEDRCSGYSVERDIILYETNQPNTSIRSGPVAPLMDQHRRYVRYQVAMNRRYFEYIRAH